LLPPEHAFPQDYLQKGLPKGIVSIEALTGQYTQNANGASSVQTNDAAMITSFDEEEYDVEDDDGEDDEYQTEEPATLPATSTFPGIGGGGMTPNLFANWLGAIASTGNPPPPVSASVSDEDEDEDDVLPAPPPPPPPSTPATGMLPQKSITEVNVLPPLPPGLGGEFAAAAASSATAASLRSTPSVSTGSSYINPMELLKSIGGGGGDDTNKSGKGSKGKGRGKSPKRSKSPKNKKQQQFGATKTAFPDGKVTILKRDDNATTSDAATAAPPIPEDPSVLTEPEILAAAGIPIGATGLIPPPPVPPPTGSVTARIDHEQLQASVSKAVEVALAQAVVPAVNKSVQESFAALARPLRSSMDNLSKQGVSVDMNDLRAALDIETPIRAVMAENMRHVLVPALESISSQILQQVQASIQPPLPDNTKALDVLTQQLSAMARQMDVLTNEVQVLRKLVSEQGVRSLSASPSHPGASSHPIPPPPPPDPVAMQLEQTRQEIKQRFAVGNYEAGFTKAVSVTSTDVTLFACRNSDINKVLGSAAPAISQPIVLCLMQQLGAALSTTTDPNDLLMVVSWLQELALSLNTSDTKIKNHIPGVLQQLVTNVNSKAVTEQQQGANPQLRRPLQMLMQVLRGMQMG
jgi:enhancer of mRNA-decapping protein 4